MIAYYEPADRSEEHGVEYISAEDQCWDEATLKELWDVHKVVFMPNGIDAVHPIKVTGSPEHPLLVIGSEDDGTIYFHTYFGSYEHTFSPFWVESLVDTLNETMKRINNTKEEEKTSMTIVDKVKKVIKEDFENAPCGIFGCRNIVGDRMCNLFNEDGVCVDICFDYEYFEVIGLSDEDYYEVERYYESLFEK